MFTRVIYPIYVPQVGHLLFYDGLFVFLVLLVLELWAWI